MDLKKRRQYNKETAIFTSKVRFFQGAVLSTKNQRRLYILCQFEAWFCCFGIKHDDS
jgi:hypothetical protein